MVFPSTWAWVKARVEGKHPLNRYPLKSQLVVMVGLPRATLMITQSPPGLLPHMGLPHSGQFT